jgi:tetratricopeptide (TPR) repeat protein
LAEIRDTLILDIEAALRQIEELENALNRALSDLTIDIDVGPGVAQLDDDLTQAARAADDIADDAARMDRELSDATSSTAELEGELRQVERAAERAADETKKIDDAADDASGSFSDLAGNLGRVAVAAGAAIGLREITQFLIGTVTAATDLSESINAVEVIFGDASETILQFGADTSDAVFLAASEFNQLAAATGNLLQGFGIGVQDAADITLVLTQRAADLASVFNTEVGEALDAINAALRGETEQIRRFTGSFSIAEVKAFGQELFDTTDALTSQQQALAAVEFILQKTQAVQGDAANTAGELANQQRALNEIWTNAQATIGQALVPALESIIPLIPDLIDSFVSLVPLIEAVALTTADAAIAMIDFLGPVLDIVDAVGGVAGAVTDAEEGTSGFANALSLARRSADLVAKSAIPVVTGVNLLVGAFTETEDAVSGAGTGLVDYAAIAGEVSGAQALLNDEIEAARDLFFGYNDAAGEVAGAQALLNDEVENLDPWDRYGETLEQILEDAARLQEELDGLPAAVQAVGTAVGLSDDELLELGAAFTEAADAADRFRSITLELSDPVFAAAKAQERLTEAEEDLVDIAGDAESSAQDIANANLALATAVLEADAAARGLGNINLEGGQFDQSISILALALGLTRQEILDILEDAEILDQTVIGPQVEFLVDDDELTSVLSEIPDEVTVGIRFQANNFPATQLPDGGGTLTQVAQTPAVAPININTQIIGASDTDIVGAAAQAGNVIAGVSGATQAFRGAG